MEERKVGELEEKLGRSVDELTAVREAHLKFVSEVRSIAETKRYWKSALQVLTNMDNMGLCQLQQGKHCFTKTDEFSDNFKES